MQIGCVIQKDFCTATMHCRTDIFFAWCFTVYIKIVVTMFQDRVTKNILYKVCKIKMQESTDNSESEEKKKKTICTC